LNYLCAGYKHFFTHIDPEMQLMAGLLKQGRYADEVMGILSRGEESKPELDSAGSDPDQSDSKPSRRRRRKSK